MIFASTSTTSTRKCGCSANRRTAIVSGRSNGRGRKRRLVQPPLGPACARSARQAELEQLSSLLARAAFVRPPLAGSASPVFPSQIPNQASSRHRSATATFDGLVVTCGTAKCRHSPHCAGSEQHRTRKVLLRKLLIATALAASFLGGTIAIATSLVNLTF